MTTTVLSATHKPAGVIETHYTDAATEWGYSFTSPNPKPDDCIRCASEADAWKLAEHIRRIESALASAEPVAWELTCHGTVQQIVRREDVAAERLAYWRTFDPDASCRELVYTHAQPAAKAEAPSLDEVLATIRAYGEGCIRLGMESAPTPASDYPECSGDPASCPENEGHGCCKPNPVKTPASVPDGWLPIESAPKDGRTILLYCPQGDGSPGSTFRVTCGEWLEDHGRTIEHRDMDGRWIGQEDYEGFVGWMSADGGFSEDTMMPTLWMPMPSPPTNQEGTSP